MDDQLDGELYLDDTVPPDLSTFDNFDEEVSGVFELLETDEALTDKTVFERAIFKYKDPTSLPHTRK